MENTDIQLISFSLLIPSPAIVGSTVQSIVTDVMPSPAVDNNLNYSKPTYVSSDENVATIDEDGLITTVGPGAAVFTATIGTVWARSILLVKESTEAPTVVTIATDVDKLKIGEETTLTATASNDNNVYGLRTGLSNAIEIVGDKVVGTRAGFGTITGFGDNVTSNTKYIEVTKVGTLLDFDVELIPGSTVLGGTSRASVINVKSTDNYEVEVDDAVWSASNPEVATISSTGVITPVTVGQCQIVCELDGIVRSKKLIVSAPMLASFNVVQYPEVVNGKSPASLRIEDILPEGAVIKPFYIALTPSIANISQQGNIMLMQKGTAKFKVVDGNTGVSKVVDIVYDPNSDAPIMPTQVVFEEPPELKVGDTYQTIVHVHPEGADSSVTYDSDNTSIATISASGLVTANAVGLTQVNAISSVDSEITGHAAIKVVEVKPTAVNIVGPSSVRTSETGTYTATLTPSNTTNKSVVWSIDAGEESATIDPSTGILTPLSVGSVTIMVKSSADNTINSTRIIEVIA